MLMGERNEENEKILTIVEAGLCAPTRIMLLSPVSTFQNLPNNMCSNHVFQGQLYFVLF